MFLAEFLHIHMLLWIACFN